MLPPDSAVQSSQPEEQCSVHLSWGRGREEKRKEILSISISLLSSSVDFLPLQTPPPPKGEGGGKKAERESFLCRGREK